MNRIIYLKVGPKFSAVHERLLPLLSNERQEKILECRKSGDKLCQFFSELLVRIVVSEQMKTDVKDILFGTNEHGKPYILGWPTFHYNVSHTDGFVVVAVSDQEVGVDAEMIAVPKKRIADRLFSNSEKEYAKLEDKNFFEVWTKKEAYFKKQGIGITPKLVKSIDVFDSINRDKFRTYLLENVVVSVFSDSQNDFELTEVTEQEILKML